MVGTSESSRDHPHVEIDSFPDGLTAGTTVLIAGTVDPSRFAVGLRALGRYGNADDTALVVTTTEGTDETVATYEDVCDQSTAPSLGIVDATSERQSVTALYEEVPVVFVTGPGDLERIIVGLSDLTGTRPPSSGTRHLLVRSLTPILESTSVDDVCTVLERITGLRTDSGLTLLGIDYTAHDEETMTALSTQVDGILWVTDRSGTLAFEFDRSGSRYNHASSGGATHD